MRLFREPLAQFAVLGALLFGLWSGVRHRGSPPAGNSALPVSRTVAIADADVEGMRASFRAAWKRNATSAELADLVQVFLSEEILFNEGISRGLDRDDRVVRRRIIEKMTALARPSPRTSDPPRDELRRWYQMYQHRFIRPESVTYEQLFFDPAKRERGDARAAAAAALDATLRAAAPVNHLPSPLPLPSPSPPPTGVGDTFVLPAKMPAKSRLELAHLLGEEFADAIFAAPIGRWHGPLTSKYGAHLVRVRERQAEGLPPFEEVEKQVRADWLTQENRGLRASAEALLPKYDIALSPALRSELQTAAAMAPFLQRVR